MNSLPFFPTRASTIGGPIDELYFAWLILAGIVAIAVAVTMIGFAIRYRRGSSASRVIAGPAEHARTVHHIEITWTIVPLVLFLGMFAWSAEVYIAASGCPEMRCRCTSSPSNGCGMPSTPPESVKSMNCTSRSTVRSSS